MNNSIKYTIATIILLVGVVGISFYSCEKEEITPNATAEPDGVREMIQDETNTIRTTEVSPEGEELIAASDFLDENYKFVESELFCGKYFTKDVMNEDGKVIGASYVFNTDKYFYVYLVSDNGFVMKNAMMHFASNPRSFPLTKDGKPDFTKFKYSSVNENEIGRVMNFKIPVDQLKGEAIVSVTAEFKNENNEWHRGWVGASILQGSVNLRIFDYNEQKCEVTPVGPVTPEGNEANS